MQSNRIQQKVVGLIPAAGKAERISPLPCSKEIYPVGFRMSDHNENFLPKVVSEYLIESMQFAHVANVYIVLRKGKWDIPDYLGSGKWMDTDLAYLIMDLPFGVPFTIDQAYNFLKDNIVFFGFPDIIFKPRDAFIHLLEKQTSKGADVVLGLFLAPQPHDLQHMVDFDSNGRIRGFQIKPTETKLQYTWVIAVWNQRFTHFLHEYVLSEIKTIRKRMPRKKDYSPEEVSVTEVFEAAQQKGLIMDSVIFNEGYFLDIGSPDNLKKATQIISEFENLRKSK